MSVFYDLNKTPRNILNQAIVRAIVSENGGALFDIDDMSTMFQDAAGTTPVTAVEQPVGKILDKSGNGNHATQSVTAWRPTLSARYNLLTKTEDFSDAVWIKTRLTTQSAKVLSISAGADSRVTQEVSGSGGFTITAVFSSADVGKRIRLGFWASGIDGISGNGISEDLVIPDSGIVSFTKTGLVSMTNIGIINSADGVAKTLTLRDGFGVSLLPTSTLFQYQRVNTATDYDTDPTKFPKYLNFDGVDDYLTLGDVFDIGINGVSISASVILFSSTQSPIAGKSRAASAGGRYFLGVNPDSFLFASHDSAPPVEITYSQSIGESVVLSAKLGPHGDRRLSLYKNANLLSTVNTSLTTASYDTTDPFWIGAYPNSTGTTPAYGYLKGGIYGLIVTKSALTDAQRVRCERFLAQKAGVML